MLPDLQLDMIVRLRKPHPAGDMSGKSSASERTSGWSAPPAVIVCCSPDVSFLIA